MELADDVYEAELIDAFDAPEPEAPAPTKLPTTSPQFKGLNLGQPTRRKVENFHPKTNIPTLYPTFDDTLEAPETPAMPPSEQHDKVEVKEVQQQKSPPLASMYREEELMSEEELQRRRKQIEHELRVYQERFDHVAQALAGETPHQIQERKRREEERLGRQEKRYEAMETRLQHQIERLEEREDRRARIQLRHHRASRNPSPSDREGEVGLTEDVGHGKQEQEQEQE